MQNGHSMRKLNYSSHSSGKDRMLRPRKTPACFLTFTCDAPAQGEQGFTVLRIRSGAGSPDAVVSAAGEISLKYGGWRCSLGWSVLRNNWAKCGLQPNSSYITEGPM